MADLFRNKYRIPSNRLRGWNYAANGHYFITMVTAGRNMLFGNVKNGEMVLNDIGRIVYDEFFRSFEMRAELFLGEFVLMPNHLHAIVILDKTQCLSTNSDADNCGNARPVETHGRASLQRQPKSISSFVAGFKSATTNSIDDWIDSNNIPMPKFNRNNPLWQSNYNDRIIRDYPEYQRISDYIVNNPMKWEDDEYI
ncbi:MAG: hypothetical protein J6T33_09235 [Bacteroidales bacterium]|nr:hypothetical protein [Bacteroidales bacterium]